MPEYQMACIDYGVKYIQRQNVGFDTAPFQDICLERLGGFDNDWEKLFWVTDDWFPMSKKFIKSFMNYWVEGEVGCVCTQISDDVKRHIRTAGFLISKDVSRNLIWDTPQVVTKDDCYNFEHRSPNALYEQILRMGLRVEVVAPLETSPIWDTGHNGHLNRMSEHESIFYTKNKVGIICPIYKSYPQIISSMITQTYTNWEVIAVDDCGPEDGTREAVEAFAQKVPNHRIIYHRQEKNAGVSAARNTAIGMAQGEYLAFLDPDDWWASEYLNEQVRILLSEKGTFCFCSNILVDEKGKEISIRTPTEFFLDNLPASLVYQNYLNPSAVVMRRLDGLKVGIFD
jgi:hypothetical protein